MQNNVFYKSIPLNPIRIQFTEGIYLVKRKSDVLVIEHYGVVIVGKLLQQLGFSEKHPLVFHLTEKGICVEWLELFGDFQLLGEVGQREISNALLRLKFAFNNPNFDLFSNNCEQFARYITEGYKHSTQLQNAGVLGGIALALIFLRD